MNIHEYQGKQILSSFGVATQRGYVASSSEEAVEVSKKLQAEALSAKAGGQQRAAAILAEGRAQAISSMIGAFTTVAGGLHQYNLIRTGG